MVHKTSLIPGLTQFIDNSILSHYPPTSMKRILAAGAISLYLKQNSNIVDAIFSNPMFAGLKVSTDSGMLDIDTIRDVLKDEVNKVGFMRMSFPIIGDVDFTAEDIDTLHKYIHDIDSQGKQSQVGAIVDAAASRLPIMQTVNTSLNTNVSGGLL